MNRLIGFFGNFHPALVHLPIGFLLLALILQWLSVKEKYTGILPAVRVSFLLGMISAVLSCLSGLSLSSGGEYDESTLEFHKWFGISVAVFSAIGYLYSAKPETALKKTISIVTFVLIIVTGHLGGTLAYGEGFLTKGLTNSSDSSGKLTRKPIPNVQEAGVFTDIIQPVLHTKCGGCHSAVKQKGGLRLDGKEWILKGGKDGKVFISGQPGNSEMYKRVLLDPLEEDHMPPKGKPQLTEQEINLLHWWINSDAGFEKKVREVVQTPQVITALLALQSVAAEKKSSVPSVQVEQVSQVVLDSLRNAGIIILPVAANSHYLQANFVSIPKAGDKAVSLLRLVKKQLVWLKLAGAKLAPASWKTVADCNNLTRLSIEHSNISDTTIQSFSSLQHLQYLNLVGTPVSVQGLQQLKNLPALENIYLAQTRLSRTDFFTLQKIFPKTIIDSGNYYVENLALDTQLLKPPPVKK
jgi:uncharacterized membrane protein/Leucine-rich repeat (LRR) protein